MREAHERRSRIGDALVLRLARLSRAGTRSRLGDARHTPDSTGMGDATSEGQEASP